MPPDVLYREPARGFASSYLLAGLIVAGFLFDLLVIGGGGAHALAWAGALVIVVGADLITIRAARSVRSITVTSTRLTVGDESLARASLTGVDLDVADAATAMGCPPGVGLPRRVPGLGLTLTDGALHVVPTRHPLELAEVLGLSPARPSVRPATAEELAQLPEIDRRAEALFTVSGSALPEIPFPLDELHDARAVFVVGHPVVGFVRVDEVDGLAHVAGLAVLPGSMRQGLGGALLEAAAGWAAEQGYPAITLTAYAEVAWNAPFYARHGFVELPELTPELAELRDWERSVGLDEVGPRIAMRRPLG